MGAGKRRKLNQANQAMESAEARAGRQVLQERAARVARCHGELLELLARHNCTLQVGVMATGLPGAAPAGVTFMANVVPLEQAAAATIPLAPPDPAIAQSKAK